MPTSGPSLKNGKGYPVTLHSYILQGTLCHAVLEMAHHIYTHLLSSLNVRRTFTIKHTFIWCQLLQAHVLTTATYCDRTLYGKVWNYTTNMFGSTISTYNVKFRVHRHAYMYVYIPSLPNLPTSSFAKSGRWKGLRMRL